MTKPVIGITLDLEEKKTYSVFPWYAGRRNYADSISKVGGIPVFIPHDEHLIEKYIDIIDGIVITGGDFDVDPNLYGEKKTHEKVQLKKSRTNFEFKITELAIKKNVPILGICGGEQLLNVVFGGSLFQHIPDDIITDINHEQPNPRNQGSHKVLIEKKSILNSIVGTDEMFVNSAHHQSVNKIGKKLIISAYAPDGVVEAIEGVDLNFCIGIQWHPEFLIDKNDIKIFSALVKASQ